MRSFPHLGTFALVAGLWAVGCGVTQEPLGDERAGEEEDAVGTELSAKASGITVWLDPVARATTRFDQPAWVLSGRTSKNLSSVFSFSSDDEFAEAIQVSPRKFDVYMDAGQAEHLMAGYRLIVDLDTTSGATRQYFASIRIAPRFDRFHGSSKLTLHKTVTPFVFGQQIRFRNLVGVASGYSDLGAQTASGGMPLLIAPQSGSFAMDWAGADLLAVATDSENEMTVSAQKAGQTVNRFQGVDLVVKSLQLTTDLLPLETWPDPTCKASTSACLQALPPSQLDRSSCGAAIDVRACVGVALPTPDAERFHNDLVGHLVGWYDDHGADVAASGGNSLGEAQALCSTSNIEEVTDPEGDPEAHDLEQFIVFSHPDVVWPGSDIVWFGAYDRATGALSAVYDFN